MLGMFPINVGQLKTRVGCWSMSIWEDIRAGLAKKLPENIDAVKSV